MVKKFFCKRTKREITENEKSVSAGAVRRWRRDKWLLGECKAIKENFLCFPSIERKKKIERELSQLFSFLFCLSTITCESLREVEKILKILIFQSLNIIKNCNLWSKIFLSEVRLKMLWLEFHKVCLIWELNFNLLWPSSLNSIQFSEVCCKFS